jgi:hypothetical protein
MTMRLSLTAVFGVAVVSLTVGFGPPEPAAAKKNCGANGHWCSSQCGAWNNWCRPACGDWNAWCAGQSLPDVLSRMQPRSYFADPKWHGQSYADEAEAAPPPRKTGKWLKRKRATTN